MIYVHSSLVESHLKPLATDRLKSIVRAVAILLTFTICFAQEVEPPVEPVPAEPTPEETAYQAAVDSIDKDLKAELKKLKLNYTEEEFPGLGLVIKTRRPSALSKKKPELGPSGR